MWHLGTQSHAGSCQTKIRVAVPVRNGGLSRRRPRQLVLLLLALSALPRPRLRGGAGVPPRVSRPAAPPSRPDSASVPRDEGRLGPSGLGVTEPAGAAATSADRRPRPDRGHRRARRRIRTAWSSRRPTRMRRGLRRVLSERAFSAAQCARIVVAPGGRPRPLPGVSPQPRSSTAAWYGVGTRRCSSCQPAGRCEVAAQGLHAYADLGATSAAWRADEAT